MPSPPEVRERVLDVRPILASGGDAFRTIIEVTRCLAPDETLHLIAPFDPRPLYATMRSFHRAPRVEERADAFHVFFKHEPATANDGELLPSVTIDVRGREGAHATLTILQALTSAGAQLVVRADREPEALHEKLALRGYDARVESCCDGGLLLHIAPTWARIRDGRGPIHALLARDHVRLEQLLAKGVDDEAAYTEFRSGLARHIAIEEKIVVLETRRLGVDVPQFERMRKDHGKLVALLVPPPTRSVVDDIRAILEPHDAIEEADGGIYDVCDRALASSIDDILARIAAQPDVPMRPYNNGKRRPWTQR